MGSSESASDIQSKWHIYGIGPKGRRLHPVWEYFAVVEFNTLKCLECGRKFKTISSTTVCKHHMRSRHPEIFARLMKEVSDQDWRSKTAVSYAELSNEQKLFLIECVRDRPVVWKSLDTKSNAIVEEFKEIANMFTEKFQLNIKGL